ncbi:hypothetical protein [Bosea sp. AS-1]|uniref:hypothetical protein n=1 Tax=Bosea sp. AS-1 TaxID=2015316 RepID=UPI000B772A5D|nr:hypothetical protein [Bosea sp. AS-1]
MSADFDFDDMARLLALEHAFLSIALISAGNFSGLNNVSTSEAVQMFRDAIEGSVYDAGARPKELQVAMSAHLKRMFDHIATMAKHADQGAS